ncbi:uncharacterized protein IL334_006368 [Kwoniella shivajii]|uniref:DNA repair protein Swi5/Sae3 n=1 Tax=Kwoniella shivajii TaxID=564305 RepID=A0ABZ1D5R8_9TREE|nr:hypothetical protein IL334_006368 [Kwoniella shivajii]
MSQSSCRKSPDTTSSAAISTSSAPTSTSSTRTNMSKQSTKDDRILALQEEIQNLKAGLGEYDPNVIIQNHIRLLHTYNEVKDGTQSLIGKYAQITGKTIREAHVEMGLPLTD